jgi:LacI family transcriptional regulator
LTRTQGWCKRLHSAPDSKFTSRAPGVAGRWPRESVLATIRDVARAAGVSIATVSRVFNGSNRVSDAARRRVQSAAVRLDYLPNVAARSLTTSRTHALGVLLPDLYGEFFSDVIRGIDHAARRGKYQILLASSHADAHDLLAAARSMRGRIDGLVAMASDRDSAAAIAQVARYFSVVILNPRARVDGCSSVSIANLQGARALVEHLIGLGHRRVGIIQGPAGNGDAEQRRRGYRQALRGAGIPHDPSLEFRGDFTEASGHAAAQEILRCTPRPTAIFAANDYMAIGALSALREAGVDVPGEMAVTGFDDIAMARYLSPPLTTVCVDAFELGERAIEVWMQRAADPSHRRHEVLPATVVVRSSCGSTQTATSHTGGPRRRNGRHAPETGAAATNTDSGAAGRGVPVSLPPRGRRRTVSRSPRRKP